ncbi:MAG TPA: GTP cyclohydrolase I FolE [Polyangiaceae bacterium]|nr:GTP cyclohydrolase I FolE [Polyangiaceae bacterium]
MIDQAKIRAAIRLYLEGIGENPNREGLVGTPDRVARMCEEVFSGIDRDPRKLMEAVFTEKYSDIVLIRDIPFNSMCEHHLLPFTGHAHVAYIPNGRVLGLSKFARVLDVYSQRPQVQERLTDQVADLIMDELKPIAVAVIVDATHSCMTLRGVRKPGSSVITSALRGTFLSDPASRSEVLSLMRGQV